MVQDLLFRSLREKLDSFHAPSKPFLDAVYPILEEVHMPRGGMLIKSGHRPKKRWYLYHGFAREIGNDEDSERTTWFFSPGDFVYAYPSFFSQLPAFRDVEIISDSILLEVSFQNLILLRHRFEELVNLIDIARDCCDLERGRLVSMRENLSAKERYDRYFNDHKLLFNFAKHKDIASLLGIKSDGFRRYNA
jgi:hypothetical protein